MFKVTITHWVLPSYKLLHLWWKTSLKSPFSSNSTIGAGLWEDLQEDAEAGLYIWRPQSAGPSPRSAPEHRLPGERTQHTPRCSHLIIIMNICEPTATSNDCLSFCRSRPSVRKWSHHGFLTPPPQPFVAASPPLNLPPRKPKSKPPSKKSPKERDQLLPAAVWEEVEPLEQMCVNVTQKEWVCRKGIKQWSTVLFLSQMAMKTF